MNNYSGIMWANGSYLWLVIGVGLLCAAIAVWRLRRVYYAKKMLAGTSASQVLKQRAVGIDGIKTVLWVLGFLFLMVSLLRPYVRSQEESVKQQGRDLLIAVDVSRSMLAQDCEPNRLAVTKEKIRSLLRHISSDRVGLILFSGDAYVQCPLTSDHAAFFMFLDALDVETLSSGSTALDKAIRTGLQVFEQIPDRKSKLLVLFTDGEDFSTDLSGIQEAAQQARMNIFTMGVGTQAGAPIPLFDDKGKSRGHQKDKKGAVVISRLNEQLLRDIAVKTGGAYVRVSCEDDRDIVALVQKVTAYEKEFFDDKKIVQRHEVYHWLLVASFICLALEWML